MTVAEECSKDEDVRKFTCSCEHNVEDHVPADFADAQPCAVDDCPCRRFQRMTAFGWLLRASGGVL